MDMFMVQHKREWHVFITHAMSKVHFLEYAGRYIRRPPIARHRLKIVKDATVEYLAKDTRNNRRRIVGEPVDSAAKGCVVS